VRDARELWPWFSLALIIGGLAARNALVVMVGFGVLVACGGAVLWARWSLRRLTYERVLPEDRAFAGESVDLTLRITNRKPLPLAWIEAEEQLPAAMIAGVDDPLHPTGHGDAVSLRWRTSAGAYDRASRHVRLLCPARGIWEIGPARLRSGDPFGLFDDARQEEGRARVVVYPETVMLRDLGLPARRPYGERPRGLPVFEDPSRVHGIRDYRPGDSMRRVDWNATARLGKMQSRVYEPSSSQYLLLCVNTQTMTPAWAGYIHELLERCITVAASVARDAYDRRYSVGLLVNSSVPEADRAIRIAPGRRPEQFIRVLEALGVVTPFVLEALAAMLDREEHRLLVGTTVVVVTATMPEALAATLLRLRGRGHEVAVLSASGDAWSEELGPIPVHDVSHVEAVWAEARA